MYRCLRASDLISPSQTVHRLRLGWTDPAKISNSGRRDLHPDMNCRRQAVAIDVTNAPQTSVRIGSRRQRSARISDCLERPAEEARNSKLKILHEGGIFSTRIVPPIWEERHRDKVLPETGLREALEQGFERSGFD
jgi:hypothetical protein